MRHSSVLSVTCGFSAATHTGCSSDVGVEEQQDDIGNVSLALSGVSTQGVEYRLSTGALRFLGPVNSTVQAADYLGATQITRELPAGDYLLRLENWQLTTVDGSAVNAVLVSANPLAFSVQDQQVTGVQIQFAIGSDVVSLGNGFAVVTIAIDDVETEDTSIACADGVDNDSDGSVDCNDSDCQAAGFCVGDPGTGGGAEDNAVTCSDGLDNDGNGAADCADASCVAAGFCVGDPGAGGGAEDNAVTCSDGVDNDGNGAADCADTNCVALGFCG